MQFENSIKNYYRPRTTILFLKPVFTLSNKPLKIMEKHTIQYSLFRMPLTIYPGHSRDEFVDILFFIVLIGIVLLVMLTMAIRLDSIRVLDSNNIFAVLLFLVERTAL